MMLFGVKYCSVCIVAVCCFAVCVAEGACGNCPNQHCICCCCCWYCVFFFFLLLIEMVINNMFVSYNTFTVDTSGARSGSVSVWMGVGERVGGGSH